MRELKVRDHHCDLPEGTFKLTESVSEQIPVPSSQSDHRGVEPQYRQGFHCLHRLKLHFKMMFLKPSLVLVRSRRIASITLHSELEFSPAPKLSAVIWNRDPSPEVNPCNTFESSTSSRERR